MGVERYDWPKWAMVSYKGGTCQCGCGRAATLTTLARFHFHHRDPVGNGYSGADRWNRVRFMQIFSDEWKAWGDSVDLLFDECHRRIEREINGFGSKQLEIDWDFQARMDALEPVKIKTETNEESLLARWRADYSRGK